MAAISESDGAYAEDAPLMALFGVPARTKLLSVFVADRGRELTVSDLSRQAGVGRTTVYNHIGELQDLGVIEQAGTINAGHSPVYRLNEDSHIAELCYQLEGITLRRLLEQDGHLEE